MTKLEWRSTIRDIAYRLLLHAGYVALVRRKWRQQIRILLYHSVAPKQNPFVRGIDVTVSPRVFEQQLCYLERHYHIISLQDLVARLRDRNVYERAIVITFDDGFQDNYEFAWPILRKHGVTATIFPNMDSIGNRQMLWVHKLTYLANCAGVQQLWKVACQHWPTLASVRGETSNRFMTIMDLLVSRVLPVERDAFLLAAFQSLEVAEPVPQEVGLYLSWDQVYEMATAGIEFGNHTCSHPNLALLTEMDQEYEIVKAQEIIVERLQRHELSFAYPFGLSHHFSNVTRDIVRKSGHYCALTSMGNRNDLDTSPYCLNRIKVEEEALPQFAARIEDIWLSQMMRLRR